MLDLLTLLAMLILWVVNVNHLISFYAIGVDGRPWLASAWRRRSRPRNAAGRRRGIINGTVADQTAPVAIFVVAEFTEGAWPIRDRFLSWSSC